ncbi:PepSY domain-containing protein [Romboutsia lituseburensis]|uniref:Uncharacterized membrane protein YkoI n=1 Tax=Romboutsia lituseburensis DSM 797 TaxID=1121325 RepID=A0A1G9PQU1_9FIRM|nr:PepSY domain-containing protein [Romboutsia lituseburensis]CEH33464.1 Prokaryotic membrane lipoprotein lipid attachment site profile [Romboutsia lituseburensis]SDM00455.1 Uncharacterized membrane protein YkoI [Romboutsia lituseburensis DSM 797]
MKKTLIATLIISTSMFFVACNNSTPVKDEAPKEQATQNKITIEEAKDIALKHAKLTNDKVTFVKSEENMDNGVKTYDVEFYVDKTEYDYEINADTGEIIEFDQDIEDHEINQDKKLNNNNAKITEEQAKEIALKHANLTSDKVNFSKVEYEIDKTTGIENYDIDFYYNNQEYSYDIDSQSGKVISYEIDKK